MKANLATTVKERRNGSLDLATARSLGMTEKMGRIKKSAERSFFVWKNWGWGRGVAMDAPSLHLHGIIRMPFFEKKIPQTTALDKEGLFSMY